MTDIEAKKLKQRLYMREYMRLYYMRHRKARIRAFRRYYRAHRAERILWQRNYRRRKRGVVLNE